MTNPPIINIQNITKQFGANFRAVDDVSLDIADNEFFALLGPSGCGKTTLLRMLAGFEVPTAGTILLSGDDITLKPPHRRPVNMVFQSYAVFPHMTVAENVAYGLKVTGVSKADAGPRVEEALAMVRLGPLGGRKPDQLSGGQRQRVALARALVKRPKVLLLDEPLSALDKKLREEMQLELVRLRHEVGITFIMVTHDQEEAMAVASRIGVMQAGKLAQIAPPTELYEHPANRFTADFVGSINFFDGTVVALEGGQASVRCPDLPTDLLVDTPHGIATGAALTIGVRPEKMATADTVPPPAAQLINQLTGTVAEVSYLGERSVLHIALDRATASDSDRPLIKVSQPNDRRYGGQSSPVGPGTPVTVWWRPDSGIALTQ